MSGRPRRRNFATMEKDHQAADLYRRGLSYRQISAQMGWKSPQSALDAVRRAARDAAQDPLAAEEAHALMLERLQDYRRLMNRVASAKHYVVSDGKVVLNPDNDKQPLIDDAPIWHAVDRLMKIEDHEAKLRGLYAAAKTRIEVVPEDIVDQELAELVEEIKRADAENAAADPGAA